MKLQLIRSAVIALAIISYVYFQIHSCSKDSITAPEPPSPVIENIICAASDVYFSDSKFGGVSGSLGTLMITPDAGDTWTGTTLEAGVLNDIQFVGNTKGWVVGKDGAVYSTVDGGATWTPNMGPGRPSDEDFFRIQFFSDNLGYLLGYRGLYRTDNGGASWENNWLAIVPDRGALDVSFVSDRKAFLLGCRYLESDPIFLYRTTNGGTVWTPVEGSRASNLRTALTIWFVDERIGWAGGGVILKTTDGGSTWTTQRSPATVREFFFFDGEHGFAVGGKAILRTADGGASWQDVTPADERIVDLRGVHFLDERNGWVVGRGKDERNGERIFKRSLLLVTADGGSTWKIRQFLFDYTTFQSAGDAAGD